MTSPAEIISRALAVSPRESEFLDLPPVDGWSDADKRAAAQTLVEAAAKRGEWRAPYAIPSFLPPAESDAALRELLSARDLAVRHAAAATLASATPDELHRSLADQLVAGNGSVTTLHKVARLLLVKEGEANLRAWMVDTKDETARSAIIQTLWDARELGKLQHTWWAGWGLFYDRLKSPIPSIRRAAVLDLRARLEGRAPLAADPEGATQPPPELWALMQDVMNGKGAIDPAALAALAPEARTALLVFAAKEAEGFANPRGLEYVDAIDGAAHRDLFELLAKSPKPGLAEAAAGLLQKLDAN